MTRRKTIVAGAVSTLAAAVALAGCSSAKPSSGGSAATAPVSPSAVAAAPAISGTQLTGTQLTAARLTRNDLPVAGFTYDTGASDSGGSLTTAKAKFTPDTMSCADLQDHFGEGGFGETAWSADAMVDPASKETLSETIYQFADATAAKALYTTYEARTSSDACHTVTINDQNVSTTLTITITPVRSGVGQQAFADTQIGTVNGKPTALAMTVALDGPDVLMVGADKQGQTTVPTDIDAGSLLAKLIAKVAAAG